MVLDSLYIILVIAFILSIPIIIRKRNKGVTGIKSALTSICLLLMVLINILSYWFDFMGLLSSSISLILLILAAYCTRYIPSEGAS